MREAAEVEFVFNKPAPVGEASLLNKSSCLALALSVNRFANVKNDSVHTLLCHLGQT